MMRDSEVDRLFSGHYPEDERLAGLVPLVRALRHAAATSPSQQEAMRVAREAARLASSARPTPTTTRKAPRNASRIRFTRPGARLAGALGALVILLTASGGVAYAADQAIPGDPLYGLDTALEDLGLGSGGLHERLFESSALVQRGQVGLGLVTAAEAIARYSPGDDDARQAADILRAAAQAASGGQGTSSAEVRAGVADKLLLMADGELSGCELGQAVAALARGLGVEERGKPDSPGNGGASGGGNPGNDSKGNSTTTNAKPK